MWRLLPKSIHRPPSHQHAWKMSEVYNFYIFRNLGVAYFFGSDIAMFFFGTFQKSGHFPTFRVVRTFHVKYPSRKAKILHSCGINRIFIISPNGFCPNIDVSLAIEILVIKFGQFWVRQCNICNFVVLYLTQLGDKGSKGPFRL